MGVRVGRGLAAVSTPKGYCFYLTNLPGNIGPKQVAELYRVRWEIESDNKLDKSCLHLDQIGARTGLNELHPQTLARGVGCAANSIASAMELRGDAAMKHWQELAAYLDHHGKDPNWRSRPSVLDQLRGWKISRRQKRPAIQ